MLPFTRLICNSMSVKIEDSFLVPVHALDYESLWMLPLGSIIVGGDFLQWAYLWLGF